MAAPGRGRSERCEGKQRAHLPHTHHPTPAPYHLPRVAGSEATIACTGDVPEKAPGGDEWAAALASLQNASTVALSFDSVNFTAAAFQRALTLVVGVGEPASVGSVSVNFNGCTMLGVEVRTRFVLFVCILLLHSEFRDCPAAQRPASVCTRAGKQAGAAERWIASFKMQAPPVLPRRHLTLRPPPPPPPQVDLATAAPLAGSTQYVINLSSCSVRDSAVNATAFLAAQTNLDVSLRLLGSGEGCLAAWLIGCPTG